MMNKRIRHGVPLLPVASLLFVLQLNCYWIAEVGDCTEDSECVTGELCEGGLCVAGCRIDSDCQTGTICVEFSAENQFSWSEVVDDSHADWSEGYACAACSGEFDYLCPNGFARTFCKSETMGSHGCCDTCLVTRVRCELYLGVCTDGCRIDADCGTGKICEGIECVQGCRVDGDCGSGTICEGINCVPGCRDSADCADGYKCEGKKCVLGCGKDEDCGGDNICNKGCMNFVPAGSFWMGCNASVDSSCGADESHYHQVTLAGYHIDRTEVVQSEYKKCVDSGECSAPGCGWDPTGTPDRPVVCVRWGDANAYCNWSGKRLPTEAEWERAARGGNGRKYPWGNEAATCDYAVMKEPISNPGCGKSRTWDVCSKSPAGDSPYGLCDMAGNVWEWVADWYNSGYYTNNPVSNPTGPAGGYERVKRGGSLYDDSDYALRASDRGYDSPSYSHDGLGFRCARSQ